MSGVPASIGIEFNQAMAACHSPAPAISSVTRVRTKSTPLAMFPSSRRISSPSRASVSS